MGPDGRRQRAGLPRGVYVLQALVDGAVGMGAAGSYRI